MTKLTCALIGCGAIAREHLSALRTLNNVEIAAVCDLSSARAEATAERFGVGKWYLNYDEMLHQVRPNVVHVTTPPSSHFPIVKDCLSRHVNVLCEKPITVDYQQFKTLKQLAIEKKCVLVENQQLRFHSSIKHIQELIKLGKFGDLVDVQIFFALNLVAQDSPYLDRNVPHFGMSLRGGAIGDFLTHLAYLSYVFTGPVRDLHSIWIKRAKNECLPYDEFRGFVEGERVTAYLGFSGNSKINGYWVRVIGTEMQAEANLLEPPRLTVRRYRSGEPALASLFDGFTEARAVFKTTITAFWWKLAGTSSYDGFTEMMCETYRALVTNTQPISLDEIDEVSRLVDRFSRSASTS
jgi:predicted dehydrogenase